MEFIYLMDNVDCFMSMPKFIIIDGKQDEIRNILHDISDFHMYYNKKDKYIFTYIIPDLFLIGDTIRAVSCCGLIETLEVNKINDKEYIALIQKESVKGYPDRVDEHTQYTDMLYSILTTNQQLVHTGTPDGHGNIIVDGGSINV